MKKSIFKSIEIPEGIKVTLDGAKITVENDGKKNEREFDLMNLTLEKKGNEIIIGHKKSSKNEKK